MVIFGLVLILLVVHIAMSHGAISDGIGHIFGQDNLGFTIAHTT